MKKVQSAIVVLLAGLLAVGCTATLKKTKSGMTYKIVKGPGEQKVTVGSVMIVHITEKINDSLLGSTYQQGAPVPIDVQAQTTPYDPSEVFTQLTLGDSLYTVRSMDSFITKQPQLAERYKKTDKIIVTFKVEKIFTNKDEAATYLKELESKRIANDPKLKSEITELEQYLAQNNIKAVKTGNGVFVEMLQEGSGPVASDGKFVSIRYKGENLKGQVFDRNDSLPSKPALEFVIGAGQMIKGFDEGIKGLKQGTVANLYIPSMLAYGKQAMSEQLGEYEKLKFNIKLEKVADAPPPPPAAPVMPNTKPADTIKAK